MKLKEMKASARRVLIGRYGTVIGAYFLNMLVTFILGSMTFAALCYTIYMSGILNDAIGTSIVFSVTPVLLGAVGFTAMIVITVICDIFMRMGRRKLILNICRGRKYGVGDVFYGFKEGSRPLSYIAVCIIRGIINGLIYMVYGVLALVLAIMSAGAADSGMYDIADTVLKTVFLIIALYVSCRLYFADFVVLDRPESGVGRAFTESGRLSKGRKLKLVELSFSFIGWGLLMSICPFAGLWVKPYIEMTYAVMYLDADGTSWQLPGAAAEATDGAVPPMPDNIGTEAPQVQEAVVTAEAPQADVSQVTTEAMPTMPENTDAGSQTDTPEMTVPPSAGDMASADSSPAVDSVPATGNVPVADSSPVNDNAPDGTPSDM